MQKLKGLHFLVVSYMSLLKIDGASSESAGMIYFFTIISQKVELQIANTPGFLRGFEVAPTSKLCSQDTFFPQIEIKHHRFSKTIHMRVLKNVIHSTSAG